MRIALTVVLACLCLPAPSSSASTVVTGRLGLFHTDGKHDTYTYRIRGKSVHFRHRPAPAGSLVTLHLHGRTVSRYTIHRLRKLTATIGKSVAVILVNFADDTAEPVALAQARRTVFTEERSVKSYFAVQSFGQLQLTGEVFGYYTLPVKHEGCPYEQWQLEAERAATKAGANLAAYTNVMVLWPESGCGWAGAAYISSRDSWENGSLETAAHELGHNLGLYHARALICESLGGQAVTYSTSGCHAEEYGDVYDRMGGARHYEFNDYFKGILGWWPPSAMQTVTASGTYTIAPDETCCEGVHMLRIPKAAGTYYYLGFRQPSLFDDWNAVRWHERMPVEEGVTIRIGGELSSPTPSELLNANPLLLPPTNPNYEWFAPLTTGESYTDPGSGVSIKTTGFSASGATVAVTIPAPTPAPTPIPIPRPKPPPKKK